MRFLYLGFRVQVLGFRVLASERWGLVLGVPSLDFHMAHAFLSIPSPLSISLLPLSVQTNQHTVLVQDILGH